MSRTRMSRGLVAAVGVVIAVGAVAYLRRSNTTVANDKGRDTAQPAAAPLAIAPKPADAQTPPPLTRSTGQIALPGSGRPLISTTPGGVTPVKTPPVVGGANARPPVPPVKPAVVENPAPAKLPVEDAPLSTSANPLADGKAQIDSGNLVAGRKILNDALIGGRLSDADQQRAKELIASANEALVFSPRRFTDDSLAGSYTVQAGDRPGKMAVANAVTWEFLGRINGISDARRIRAGQTIKTIRGPFHAVVSKSKFTMDLYLGSPGERGSMYVRSFPVGLGKHGSTPTGTWMVSPSSKLKNPKWWGTPDEPAREAGDPLNPLGKFWLGLSGTDGDAVGKEGFGIHGTVDPDSIGKEMSHGCIRLVNENVERVYEMLVDGKSTIIVKD